MAIIVVCGLALIAIVIAQLLWDHSALPSFHEERLDTAPLQLVLDSRRAAAVKETS